MGIRAKRFAMITEDSVVKFLAVEDAPGTGDRQLRRAILEQL